MISVRFFGHGGFEVRGHALAAPSGSDIVCSAVSSAAVLTANTITEVLRAQALVSDENGLSLSLTQPCPEAENLIAGLELHLRGLAKQYPDNIRIIYGGNKNA